MLETVSSTNQALDELASVVRDSSLNKSTFESIVFQLSPAEKRLFLFLCQCEQANSKDIVHNCSVTNISELASRINAKLKREGDTRRAVSSRESYQDEYGLSGISKHHDLLPGLFHGAPVVSTRDSIDIQ